MCCSATKMQSCSPWLQMLTVSSTQSAAYSATPRTSGAQGRRFSRDFRRPLRVVSRKDAGSLDVSKDTEFALAKSRIPAAREGHCSSNSRSMIKINVNVFGARLIGADYSLNISAIARQVSWLFKSAVHVVQRQQGLINRSRGILFELTGMLGR